MLNINSRDNKEYMHWIKNQRSHKVSWEEIKYGKGKNDDDLAAFLRRKAEDEFYTSRETKKGFDDKKRKLETPSAH